MITPDTIVVGVDPYDITYAQFKAIQVARKSPAAPFAEGGYECLAANKVSIAFGLAVFNHESQMATDPNAIVVKFGTNNPGNCRSLRPDSGARGTVVDTPRGEFVMYDNFTEGWRDLSYRLIDPTYAYVKEGRRTIRQIIERFAPSTDSNDPDAYVNAVVSDMNAWIGSNTVAGPDRYTNMDGIRVDWIPAPDGNHGGAHDPAYKWIVIHDIEGSGPSGIQTLTTPGREASVQFVNDALNDRVAQLVGCRTEAWGAGNDNANEQGLHIENPGYAGRPFDTKVVTNCGRIVGVLARDFGIPIQRITTAQFQAGVPGILGHGDVKPQHGPQSDWHYDPGPTWDWDTMLAVAARVAGGQPSPAPQPTDTRIMVEGNPLGKFGYQSGFRARLEAIGKAISPNDVTAGILTIAGWAQEDEYPGVDGCAYQRCERGTLQWTPNTAAPFDIVMRRCGDALPVRKL